MAEPEPDIRLHGIVKRFGDTQAVAGLDLAIERGAFYDRDLRRIFAEGANSSRSLTAAAFIRGIRREVREIVAEGTGVHQYTVDHVLKNMIERSKDLKLRVGQTKRQTRRQFLVALTVQVMNMLHSGYHRIAV